MAEPSTLPLEGFGDLDQPRDEGARGDSNQRPYRDIARKVVPEMHPRCADAGREREDKRTGLGIEGRQRGGCRERRRGVAGRKRRVGRADADDQNIAPDVWTVALVVRLIAPLDEIGSTIRVVRGG